ncbi:DUF3618 domain-containing protein [Flindersiella endophytica]
MATTPDRLKAEAEQTRDKLAEDVDRLAHQASPKRKLRQETERVRDAAQALRAKATGTVKHAQQRAHEVTGAGQTGAGTRTESHTGSHTGTKAGQAAETVRSVSQQVRRTAESNPLATCLVAGFGAGFFAARLLPRRRT